MWTCVIVWKDGTSDKISIEGIKQIQITDKILTIALTQLMAVSVAEGRFEGKTPEDVQDILVYKGMIQ